MMLEHQIILTSFLCGIAYSVAGAVVLFMLEAKRPLLVDKLIGQSPAKAIVLWLVWIVALFALLIPKRNR